MNGVKVKTINHDALSNFFNKHISRETLVREIMSIKFSAPFESSLTNSQFIQTKKDLSEIIHSGELKNLTNYISDLKNQIAVNCIFKKINTSSAVPMMGLMHEIYTVLSLFVSYSRKTGLSINEFQLIPERHYSEFIRTLAVENNEVSKDIAHLIDWDAYVRSVSLKNRPVELSLKQTFFASGSFHIHYSNPLTLNHAFTKIETKNDAEKNTMSINDFINSLESKNIGSGSVAKKAIKSPFGRHRKYITYDTNLDKEVKVQANEKQPVCNEYNLENTAEKNAEKNDLFKLNLDEINALLPPKQVDLKNINSREEMQLLFNGLEKIKS